MIYHIKVTGQLNQLLQFTAFPFLTNMQAVYMIFLHIHVVKYASIYMCIYIYNTDKLSYTTKQYYAKQKTLARWD